MKTTNGTTRSRLLRQERVSRVVKQGLPVHLLPYPGFRDSCAALLVHYGSLDLAFDGSKGRMETTPGIAHFLEHELFKKEGKDALLEFGGLGASANAYTDYTSTVYYFKGTGPFEPCLDLLLDFTLKPYFDEAYIEKERKIIEQELRMYNDMPDFIAYKNLMQGLYVKHPLRIDIGGDVKDLAHITKPVLEEIYGTFYQPVNMTLVAAGAFEPEAVFRKVESKLESLGRRREERVRRVLQEDPAKIGRKHEAATMTSSRSRVLVGFKDLERENEGGAIVRDRATTGLGLDRVFGRTSDFYTKHYRDGLIDDTFSYAYRREMNFGFTLVGGESDEPERLADEVIREVKALRKRRFKDRDIKRGKKKRLGRYIASFDHPETAAFYALECMQVGIDPWKVPEAIAKIRRSEVDARLREHLLPELASVSIVKPK